MPPRSVMVLATGMAPGGRTSIVEAIFEAPPIPYAVAATGSVICGDSLILDGASTMNVLLGGGRDLSASLYAGSQSPAAVQIGALGTVSGQLRTPGDVVVGSGTRVAQGIVAHAEADSIPDIPIQSFSTAAFEGRTVMQAGVYHGQTVLSGPVYVSGDVEFRGNLQLDNAVVFVDGGGSFKAQGNVHGTGSIFATGTVYLKGNIDLITSDGIAVFSQGALQLLGGNYFQGLLYSHQSVAAAAGMNVVGAIACQSTMGGDVTLANGTHVTYLPDYARLLGASGTSSRGGLRRTFWREVTPP